MKNNVANYFWVVAYDKSGNQATNPPIAGPYMLFKSQGLIHFSTPWKMTGKVTIKTAVGVANTVDYTVPANRSALITGYHIHAGAGGTVKINMNGNILETADGTTGPITRNPSYTNGMYVDYSDVVELYSSNHAGNHGWFRVLEFDYDVDVDSVFVLLSNVASYTVTAGKTLYLTSFVTASATANYLEVFEGGAWVQIWDVQADPWSLSKGVLQFPPGTILGMDADTAFFFGVEIKGN
jgi:hypothetical protein